MMVTFKMIENSIGIPTSVQLKILQTIFVLILLWVIKYIILKIMWRNTEDVKTRYVWRKTLGYSNLILALILVGFVWINGIRFLTTYLGLLSAGIAIALKEPLANIFGWLYIVVQKSFVVGDRVQIGDVKGDVIDIRMSQFILMEIGNWVDAEQSTGRFLYIPNHWIFQKQLANYTSGFEYIWNEITLTITFESNWQKTKVILENIIKKESEKVIPHVNKVVKKATQKFMIHYQHLTPIVYIKTNDFGVIFTLRYLINPRNRRSSENKIWHDILVELAKHRDIDFAYPTQRFYNNVVEGNIGRKE